jgi:hypothetical protein
MTADMMRLAAVMALLAQKHGRDVVVEHTAPRPPAPAKPAFRWPEGGAGAKRAAERLARQRAIWTKPDAEGGA